MRLADLLELGTVELARSGVAEAALDARILLEAATNKSRTEIYLEADSRVTAKIQRLYHNLLGRRKKREPVAYILGEQEFWSLGFAVSPDVLIPRPETEFLIDRVLALGRAENFSQQGSILDLCCGSGVIAVVVAKEMGVGVIASDISARALAIAANNVQRHGLKGTVALVQGDLLSPFLGQGKFSLIVSNPPYISRDDMLHNLQPEVCGFEPHLALDGGEKGLELIKTIVAQLPAALCCGGQFFMEIGADQGAAVKELFTLHPSCADYFEVVELLQDYAGRDRVVHATRNANIT